VEAPDSCPITGSDIVLACPRSIQHVGTLVRHALCLESSANRVTVSSVDYFRVEGKGGQNPNHRYIRNFVSDQLIYEHDRSEVDGCRKWLI
jgi:hypothetical protein